MTLETFYLPSCNRILPAPGIIPSSQVSSSAIRSRYFIGISAAALVAAVEVALCAVLTPVFSVILQTHHRHLRKLLGLLLSSACRFHLCSRYRGWWPPQKVFKPPSSFPVSCFLTFLPHTLSTFQDSQCSIVPRPFPLCATLLSPNPSF